MHTLLVTFQPEELWPILRSGRHRRLPWKEGKAWRWEGQGFQAVALLAGMGETAARRSTALAIEAFSPQRVCAAGFGGALAALPPPGGLLLAGECWRLEAAESRLHRQPCLPWTTPLPELAARLQNQGLAAHLGASVTTPRVMRKADLPEAVFRLPWPVLDLETAAVATAAMARQLPFLAVRAITDGAGEEIQPFLAEIINRWQGVPLRRLLPALAADPRRVAYCGHLWRRSRLAGRHLAQALHLILTGPAPSAP